MHGIIGETGPYCSLRGKRLQAAYYIPNIRHHIQIQSSCLWGICLNWFSLLRVLRQPTQINEVHTLQEMREFALNVCKILIFVFFQRFFDVFLVPVI